MTGAPLNPKEYGVEIRAFAPQDADAVRDLFVAVNRLLTPDGMAEEFETYIEQSIAAEMGRIADYYRERGGTFWVAYHGDSLIGMFGLEPFGTDGMELRRMYVAPNARRQGIAGKMLRFAEDHCCAIGLTELHLSTSELQQAALAFYRSRGYRQLREEVAEAASNKTIGGGIRRYHFVKEF